VSCLTANGMTLRESVARSALAYVLITAYGFPIDMRGPHSRAARWITSQAMVERTIAGAGGAGRRIAQATEENVQLKRALKQRFNFSNIIARAKRCRRCWIA